LVSTPKNAVVVGYCCVYTLKYHLDDTIDRYKVRLVAKSYTQTYDVDYFKTFSSDAQLNSIRSLFSITVNMSWTLFQLDVKNTFLFGYLKEVFMDGVCW